MVTDKNRFIAGTEGRQDYLVIMEGPDGLIIGVKPLVTVGNKFLATGARVRLCRDTNQEVTMITPVKKLADQYFNEVPFQNRNSDRCSIIMGVEIDPVKDLDPDLIASKLTAPEVLDELTGYIYKTMENPKFKVLVDQDSLKEFIADTIQDHIHKVAGETKPKTPAKTGKVLAFPEKNNNPSKKK